MVYCFLGIEILPHVPSIVHLKKHEKGLHKELATIDLANDDVFGYVCKKVKAVMGNLLVDHFHYQRGYYFHHLEAFHNLVLVGLHVG